MVCRNQHLIIMKSASARNVACILMQSRAASARICSMQLNATHNATPNGSSLTTHACTIERLDSTCLSAHACDELLPLAAARAVLSRLPASSNRTCVFRVGRESTRTRVPDAMNIVGSSVASMHAPDPGLFSVFVYICDEVPSWFVEKH